MDYRGVPGSGLCVSQSTLLMARSCVQGTGIPTFNVPTLNPATVRQNVPGYVGQVVEMLLSAKLLRP